MDNMAMVIIARAANLRIPYRTTMRELKNDAQPMDSANIPKNMGNNLPSPYIS